MQEQFEVLKSRVRGYDNLRNRESVEQFCKDSLVFKKIVKHSVGGKLEQFKKMFVFVVENADSLSQVVSHIHDHREQDTKSNSFGSACYSFFTQIIAPDSDVAFFAALPDLENEVLEYAHKKNIFLIFDGKPSSNENLKASNG